MPAFVDIDYPHPGDAIGWSFFAGGDYDATGLYRDKDGKIKIGERDNLPAGSKVICRLYKADSTLLGEKNTDLGGQPAQGSWDTPSAFTLTEDADDCILRAVLQVGTEPPTGYPSDTIEDLDAHDTAGGVFEIVPPPP